GRFSTMNGCPKALVYSSAIVRDRRSIEPPGGLVAMIRTTRLGQIACCAAESPANIAVAKTSRDNVLYIFFTLRSYSLSLPHPPPCFSSITRHRGARHRTARHREARHAL